MFPNLNGMTICLTLLETVPSSCLLSQNHCCTITLVLGILI